MGSMLHSFPTEKVRLIKSTGKIIENIEALVDKKKVFIDDANVPIEEDDIIERTISVGNTEQFLVIDRGFMRGMGGIPDHYQVCVKKANQLESSKLAEVNNTYNIVNESGKLNINSNDNSLNINIPINDEKLFDTLKSLASSLENSTVVTSNIDKMCKSVGKDSFSNKYNAFIQSVANHMSIFAPFIPSLTKYL